MPPRATKPSAPVTLFLCGDVMLGRGLDQLLPHPGDPALREPYLRDARAYVALAEGLHGTIQRPVAPSYPWGAALAELDGAAPQVRLINLETSVTTRDAYWPDKGIHYRLHPQNVGCLAEARVDACALANNHVLDFGRDGLRETVEVLGRAGIRSAGAGDDLARARAPASVPLQGGGSLHFFSMGASSSGIPSGWGAGEGRSGVDLLRDLSARTAAEVAERIRRTKRPGDLAVASLHWGSNWGYAIPEEQVVFARGLVDGGVDLVHGHSSHHPRPLEVYREKLILYGCGDFLSDYEGISGEEAFRGDLRPMYLATLGAEDGRLEALRIVPFQSHRLRLRRASPEDGRWLGDTLNACSRVFGTSLRSAADGTLALVLPAH